MVFHLSFSERAVNIHQSTDLDNYLGKMESIGLGSRRVVFICLGNVVLVFIVVFLVWWKGGGLFLSLFFLQIGEIWENIKALY